MLVWTTLGHRDRFTKALFSKEGKSWQTMILETGEGMPMDSPVFPKIEGDSFENIPVARLPVSGICFSFTNLIFIPTFQGESFLAAGDGTCGILSWDQIAFCSAQRKIQAEKEQWIASELDKHRVKMFHEIFINVSRAGPKKANLLMSVPLTPFRLNDSITHCTGWCFFWEL